MDTDKDAESEGKVSEEKEDVKQIRKNFSQHVTQSVSQLITAT